MSGWPIVIYEDAGEVTEGDVTIRVYGPERKKWVDLPVGAAVKRGLGGGDRWTIKLPGFGCWFQPWHTKSTCSGNLWEVTGEMPKITVTPSLNWVGSYHGWIRDGVVTEDCEGRKFDERGELITA